MAFVYRAERNTNLTGKAASELGPGAYIGPKDYKVRPA